MHSRWPRSRCRGRRSRRAVDTVVDRLWHPTTGTFSRRANSAVSVLLTAGRDQTSILLSSKVCMIWGSPALQFARGTPCPASCRPWPAAGHCGRRCAVEHGAVLQQPAKAALKSDHHEPYRAAGTHHRTDDGVKAGTVAASGKNSNPHTPPCRASISRADTECTGEGRRCESVSSPPNGASQWRGGLTGPPSLVDSVVGQCRLMI